MGYRTKMWTCKIFDLSFCGRYLNERSISNAKWPGVLYHDHSVGGGFPE